MTEHTYVASIHKALRKAQPELYVWKINDAYQGGVADAYYSGKRDHWIEYKFLKNLPRRNGTLLDLGLSPLQKIWLQERHREGRAVSVIVGCPEGSVIFPGISWDVPISKADFAIRLVDKADVIAYIVSSVY